MAFADPQTITINAIANVLARIGFAQNAGTFQKDDATVKLGVSHSYGKRSRRVVRVDHSKFTADPYIPANQSKVSFATYLVFDEPVAGYTVAEKKQIVDALLAWLSASSGANITKILGGES